MRRSKARAALAILLFLLTGAQSLAREKWHRVRTPDFDVVGNASKGRVAEVAARLQQFRDALGLLLPGTKKVPTLQTRVVVFRDDAAYGPFKPPMKGKAQIAGHFQRGWCANHIVFCASGRTDPLAIARHEYLHEVIQRCVPYLPYWISEGLSEYYSTVEIANEGSPITVGRPITSHVLLLRKGHLRPLERLLGANQSTIKPDERVAFYAQSWALTHYLLLGNNKRRSPQLTSFMNAVADGAEWGEAFSKSFDVSFDQLEAELSTYLQLPAWRIELYTLKNPITPANLVSRELTEAEAEVYLADLLLQPFTFRNAEKHVQKALKLDPDNPSIRAVKGMLHLFKNERNDALQEYARAVSGSPDLLIPDVHFHYANALRQSSQSGDVEKQGLIVKHLQKTIELNPGLAEAYLILAQVEGLAGPELDFTINALGNLLTVVTWRDDLVIALARLYRKKGDEARCRQLLTSIVHSKRATDSTKSQAAALLQESAPSSRPASDKPTPR